MKRRFGQTTLIVLALLIGAGSAAAQAGEVDEIERSGDAIGGGVWLVRAGDAVSRTPAKAGMSVDYKDRVAVKSPWVMHLSLAMQGGGYGLLALAADSRDKRGQVVLGPAAGDSEAAISIEEARRGGARVKLDRGALFLTNWPQEACMMASGACTLNRGTAYGLRVDDSAQAYLAVTEDSVEIVWWDGPDEPAQDPADLCEAVSPGTACRQMAAPGEIWTWSVTEPPRRWDNENQALLGFATLAGMYAALDDAVDFNGRDIWDDSIFKKPLFWVTTGAVLGGVACIIWCGGDDVTGTVIINP